MRAEEKLSPEILAKAKGSPEFAWKIEEIFNAIHDAEKQNLATLGVQAQFLFPDAVCDVYWIYYWGSDRNPHETWGQYVARSAAEVSVQLENIIKNTDFLEAGTAWKIIEEKMKNPDFNLRDNIYFALYLEDEEKSEVAGV